MRSRTEPHSIDMLFPLIFILLFSFCTLLVVLQGARIYEGTAAGLQENYTVRTAVSYLKEKVRECPAASGVEIRTMDGRQTLILREDKGGETYASYIFLESGCLRELYVKDSNFIGLNGGQPLVELDSFSAELVEHNLLRLEVSGAGRTESVFIRLEG